MKTILLITALFLSPMALASNDLLQCGVWKHQVVEMEAFQISLNSNEHLTSETSALLFDNNYVVSTRNCSQYNENNCLIVLAEVISTTKTTIVEGNLDFKKVPSSSGFKDTLTINKPDFTQSKFELSCVLIQEESNDKSWEDRFKIESERFYNQVERAFNVAGDQIKRAAQVAEGQIKDELPRIEEKAQTAGRKIGKEAKRLKDKLGW